MQIHRAIFELAVGNRFPRSVSALSSSLARPRPYAQLGLSTDSIRAHLIFHSSNAASLPRNTRHAVTGTLARFHAGSTAS